MSRVVIETKGLDKLIKDMDGYTTDLHKRVSKSINRNGNATTEEARSNHKYNRQAGKLDESIQFEQDRKGDTHTADIFLRDSVTSVDGDRSYGVFQHEGTYQGYEQSPIAKKYNHSKGKGGITADPFLYRAIKKKFKINESLRGIAKRLTKKYERK